MTQLSAALMVAAICATPCRSDLPATDHLTIRGHVQTLRLYGRRGNPPILVSSGDGGWIHLGPQVAEALAARGYFVVGFDVRAYLSSFTSGGKTLDVAAEPGDYKALVDFAAAGSSTKPILVGVSEGAGLSVLAAGDSRIKSAIGGVISLGLPDANELGWRWRDATIYLTHGVPNEPTFSAAAIIQRVAPLPIALIQSTMDEFVSVDEARRIYAAAAEPKRLWLVPSRDHRFSDNAALLDQRLEEALRWIGAILPKSTR